MPVCLGAFIHMLAPMSAPMGNIIAKIVFFNISVAKVLIII
jgi:hypothetical protein